MTVSFPTSAVIVIIMHMARKLNKLSNQYRGVAGVTSIVTNILK